MLKSASGAQLTLRPSRSGATGTMTLVGRTLAINVDGVAAPSGLYVLDPKLPTEILHRYLGGWAVLPDGTVRGAIRENGVVTTNPSLNLTSLSTALPSGDTAPVVPFSGFGGGGFQSGQFGGQFGQFGGGGQIGGGGQFGGH